MAVQRAYKGEPADKLRFCTLRNSGGFYMDRAAAHDIGGEYLLFLEPTPSGPGLPAAAQGTVFVTYSCGVSQPWAEVSQSVRQDLMQLELGRQ